MGIDSVYGIGSVKPGVCTSTTRPASPYEGQVVYMTDVDQTAVWDGMSWVVLAPIASSRNVIINGGFDIWQRGTSSTVTGNTYLADRWMRAIPTGGTQSQETSDLPSGSGFRYAWKHSASATNSYMQMGQQIEYVNCKHLQGKTVTISFWAKALNSNAGSTGLTVRTRTHATVDGAAIFAGTNTDASVTLTTSWAKYTVSRTLASTFGALSLEFILGSHVSGDGFLLTGVQLEAGAVATPFEFEDYGVTLAKCQRYYYRNAATNSAITYATFGNGSTSEDNFFVTIHLPVTMRVAPTSFETSAANTFYAEVNTGAGNPTTVAFTYRATEKCFQIVFGNTAYAVGDAGQLLQDNTDAAYVAASAEL